MKFEEFNLKETLLKAIEEKGYVAATEIQQKAIPILIEKDVDMVAQAQTGTGKTAAFVLPLLEKINSASSRRNIEAIILSPTRELANQIGQELKSFCAHEPIQTLCVYGGVPIDGQIRTLKKQRPQVVVGTPGRVLDLIRRGVLKLEHARFAVLDEADEMLDMGFIDDVKRILSELGEQKNIWMFSATMPKPILSLIKEYLNNPVDIKVEKKTLSNENIEQIYHLVAGRNMLEATCRVLDSIDEMYGIIFCKTKIETKKLSDELNFRGFQSDALHGDMSQEQRDAAMRQFKLKKIKVLVCTDVAARGIDVNDLTHVINFALPQDIESYVHRIGRTGRAGKKGVAVTIVPPSEEFRMRHVERITKAKIMRKPVPTADSLISSLVQREVVKMTKKVSEDQAEAKVHESLAFFAGELESLNRDELLKLIYNHLFSKKILHYQNAPSLDYEPKARKNSRDSSPQRSRKDGMSRFFVNKGKDHGLNLTALIDVVSKGIDVDKRRIRNIELKPGFSFIEIPSFFETKLLEVGELKAATMSLRFEKSKEFSPRDGRRRSEGSANRRRS